MIYADNACDPVGRYGNTQVPGASPATTCGFWAHWRYNRADASSSGYSRHELLGRVGRSRDQERHRTVNDTRSTRGHARRPSASDRRRGVPRLPADRGRRNTTDRLYRALRWGKHVELFMLDTRQYRDANGASDSGDRPKTCSAARRSPGSKGPRRLRRTWKVIVSSVPCRSRPASRRAAVATVGGLRPATGFEKELLDILRFLASQRNLNTVWITTDVHFAEAFRYRPFPSNPEFAVYELATGPLNAGIFPVRDFDPTLNPEVLTFFGPPTSEAVTSWQEAKRWLDFGTARG